MNLFLVTSPLQYICAVEAKSHYKTKDNILILVEQTSEPGLSQQSNLLDESDWLHVIHMPRKNRSIYTPLVINKVKKILKNNQLEHFFHAEYNGWRTKLILKNIPICKEVYFDDGTLTINEYEEHIRNKSTYSRSRLFQDLLIKLSGLKSIGKLEQSKNLELFTIFDIKDPIHHIEHNSFKELMAKSGKPNLYNSKSEVGFIGQGAIGHKRRKTKEQYITEIKDIITTLDKDVIYFPHRTESDEVKSEVQRIPRVKYHVSQLPLELEIIDKNIVLSGLVGIYSTAQYTLKTLCPDIPIYNIPSNIDINGGNEEVNIRTKRIIDAFTRLGIIDIDIKRAG